MTDKTIGVAEYESLGADVLQGTSRAYITSKITKTLQSLHNIIRTARSLNKAPQPSKLWGTLFATRIDDLLSPALNAFEEQLLAYIVLYNAPVETNCGVLIEKLLSLSKDDFKQWLPDIDSSGIIIQTN